MGQPVAVTEKPCTSPGVVRFETNRNLTGMGHERYLSVLDAHGVTPAAVLARRLFATGKVGGVHVYGNMVTIDLAKGFGSDGLAEVVGNLYQYWKPGMKPPSPEELMAGLEPEAGAAPAAAAVDAGGTALTGAAARIPAPLLERSRLGRERWLAKQAG